MNSKEDIKEDIINAAVNAVAKLRSDGDDSFVSGIDYDEKSLEKCASEFKETSPKTIILIKTGKEGNKYQPWFNLLESILKVNKTGFSSDLEDVAVNVLGFSRPLHTLFRKIDYTGDFEIRLNEELNDQEALNQAKDRLLAWAKLETLAPKTYSPIFSHLTGGAKPVVFVFDDYNNFIIRPSGGNLFQPIDRESIPEEIIKRYKSFIDDKAKARDKFNDIIRGYCLTLRNLSVFCNVITPPLWIRGKKKPDYELVASALPFEEIDSLRPMVGAFIVDLEWKPTIGENKNGEGQEWAEMGFRAIHLLSRRYPEIPCFVYTGDWTNQKLQEGLAYGASWCFKKEKTHHFQPVKNKQDDASDEELLTYVNFEYQLRNSTLIQYNSFKEVPFPGQLLINDNLPPDKALIKRLEIRLPLGQCNKGKTLQKLFAGLFPGAKGISLVRIISSGKSDAQATLFVCPISFKGEQQATRFIKIGPWFSIQKEYFSYNKVIHPRLNSYVANIIGLPAKAQEGHGEMPWGAVSYSMAGFPEDYSGLCSLNNLLTEHLTKENGAEFLIDRVVKTIERVLLPLYKSSHDKPDGKRNKKPLWNWLGEVLPPVYTWQLSSLNSLDTLDKQDEFLSSYILKGFKHKEAWLLASRDLKKITDISEEYRTLWNKHNETCKHITLSDFTLSDIKWEDGEFGQGRVTITHPDLGLRIRLLGRADDIRRRFGADWVKLGISLEVTACIDKDNDNIEEKKIRDRLSEANRVYQLPDNEVGEDSNSWDPFKFFFKEGIPYYYTIDAREGPVHGDMNLENILFAKDEKVGWLIDFESAKEEGMIAFDFAKLEMEIWNNHLSPLFARFASAVDKDNHYNLLIWLLETLDYGDRGCGLFEARVRGKYNITETSELLLPIKNSIIIITAIRNLAYNQVHLSEEELRWALASYSFASIKFPNLSDWSVIYSSKISSWHLSKVAPDKNVGIERIEDLSIGSIKNPTIKKRIDGFLLDIQKGSEKSINEICTKMSESRNSKKIIWPKEIKERWDIASTGSITNITPIFGYLWLMVKANGEKSKNGDGFPVVVPKISTKGRSCGTIDILESGGLTFPSDPDAIVNECRSTGGVFCQQDDTFTPIDKALMDRRQAINAMKNFELTYASILSKKIAMGCTHAIIDVKVGWDTKVINHLMDDDKIQTIMTNVDAKLIGGDKLLNTFKEILEKSIKDEEKSIKGEIKIYEKKWIIQYPAKSLSSLKEIRWFITNADMPQCRAIGRRLILLHIDGLITGAYGPYEETLLKSESEYKTLYRERIPNICDLYGTEDEWDKLKVQWGNLKARLPDMMNLENSYKWMYELKPDNVEVPMPIVYSDDSEAHDLMMISFCLYPYQIRSKNSKVAIINMKAYYLDDLFSYLCGDNHYDPDVGIWLHKLPGEIYEEFVKVDGSKCNPIISIFYRPSRCHESEVIYRARKFLCEGVEIVR